MGDHYLPQYYLKGFSLNEGKRIWVYDKEENRRYPTQVKSTPNETGFYSTEAGSPEVERYLANSIENPANPVLEKIRNRERVTKADKRILSVYMTTMIKRVPQSKEILKGRAPTVAAEVYSEFCERLSVLNDDTPSAEEEIESLRTEAREVLDKFVEDFPKDVWLKTLSPEMTPKIVAAFTAMTWVFLLSDDKHALLTCDDPVCFFRGIGIGKPQSEVTFPISSNIALWLTWRQDLCEGYFIPPRFVVEEMNRRVAKNAARFLYHALDEDWILPFAKKGKWDLHRLNLRQKMI